MQDKVEELGFSTRNTAPMGRAALDGEYRYVAALMADIAGSTEITEKIGAEQWFHLVQEVIQLAWWTLEEFRGYPLNFTGDGIFALFGAPVAVEKASLNACRAAIALQARLEEQAARYFGEFGVSPKIRIGIAGGEVLIVGMNLGSEVKPTATGSAVNLASRLQNLAPPEGIACSAQIVLDVGEAAIFETLGEFAIKGFEEAQTAHRLIGLTAGAAASGSARDARKTAFVGRDEPLGRVMAWLEAQGSCPVCLVSGEAGIGKSRFVEELADRVASRRRLLVGSCQVETRSRSLAPIIEILRQWVGWKPGDPRSVLETALAGITGQSSDDILPLVEVVGDFGMTGERATPDAALILRGLLVAALRRLAGRDDCLLLIEDAHWIDPMSRDILIEMVSDGATSRKVLATSRHNRLLGVEDERRTLPLVLQPISRDDIARIAWARLDDLAVPAALVDLVVAKSEGNPFFATEILKHLKAGGATDLEKLRVGTIQNLLFSRFEDLPKEVRDLLRIAAVLGRTFRYPVLARAAGIEEGEVRKTLSDSGGLIEIDPGDARGSGRFVHVLFRDTIYASIPATRRAQLHLYVALAIEGLEARAELSQGSASEAASLAFHFEAAGRPLQAVGYLEIAAREALDLIALETCDTLMRAAFRIVDLQIENISFDLYGRMLEVWARCLELYGKHALNHEILTKRVPHLRKGGVSPSLLVCLAFLAKAKANVAEYEGSLVLADEVIELAGRAGEPVALAMGRIVKIKALADSGTGTLAEARALFDATRDAIDFRRDPQLTLLRMFHMISAARAMGALKESQRITEELHALGVSLNSNFLIGAAAWQESLIRFNEDDFDGVAAAAAVCVRHTIPGTTFNLCGRLAAARAEVQKGRELPAGTFRNLLLEAEQLGEVTLISTILGTIAFDHILHGRVRDWHRNMRAIRSGPTKGGSVEIRRFLIVFEAEVLMSIAGILKSGRPRPRMSLGDKLFALRLRLTARRRAERILTATAAQFDETAGGANLARILCDLALIAKARGNQARAERLCAQSVAFYTAEDCLRRADWLRGQIMGRAG